MEKIKQIKKISDEITLTSDTHQYFHNGKKLISVSKVIGKYHEPFNQEEILQKLYGNDLQTMAEKKYEWANSSPYGTYIHELLEYHISGQDNIRSLEPQFLEGVKLYEKFKNAGYNLVGCEIKVTNGIIAGTIDVLLEKDGKLTLLDFKTCDKIPKTAYGGKKMFTPLQDLDDCKYIKYSLQLSMYSKILEDSYGATIQGAYLLCIPKNGLGNIIKIRNLEKESKILLNIEKTNK